MFHFHIGTHKTGSTTLQRFFMTNAPVLAEAGVRYPKMGVVQYGHHDLARVGFRRTRAGTALLERLAEVTGARPEQTFLTSSEVFEFLEPDGIERVVGAVRGHEIRAFIYVRDFTRLMPSKYSQRTKSGSNRDDFDAFFEAVIGTNAVQAYQPAANWASVIGWENVRVRALDPRSLANGDLIADALEAIGLDASLIARCDPASLTSVNATPHWTAVEAMRAITARLAERGIDLSEVGPPPERRRHMPKTVTAVSTACQKAAVATRLVERPVQFLTPEQWGELARRYRDDIERLAAATSGPRLPDITEEAPGARPFVPSLAALAQRERRAMREALAETAAVAGLPDDIRDEVLRAIDDTPAIAAAGPAPSAASVGATPPEPVPEPAPAPERRRGIGGRMARLFARR
jgi:hypothetical protein